MKKEARPSNSQVAPSAEPGTATPDDRDNEKRWENHRVGFFVFLLLSEIIIIVLWALVVDYSLIAQGREPDLTAEDLKKFYPFEQDVNVMMFIGFGFLMTFLHKYGFSAVGYNFVVTAFCVQLAILFTGFWERIYEHIYLHPGHGFDEKLHVTVIGMTRALFTAAGILISMGACLGKTSPLQLLVMALFEVFFITMNETICVFMLRAVDMGASMVVHTFGAYFGLAVSRVISRADVREGVAGKKELVPHKDERSSRSSDVTAMVGTLFLWMFWPSFNGALASGDAQQRVIVNTFFSLSACCCTAFLTDNLIRPGRKFSMVSIQNATLAGGVAMGAASDMAVQPFGAMIIGAVAGVLSVVGYVYLQPCLAKSMGLHDTCGVNNLHGMPGILGGIAAGVAAYLADPARGFYVSEEQIQGIFAARRPCEPNSTLDTYNVEPCGLTSSEQSGQQFAALGVSILLGVSCGIFTGFVIKLPCLLPPGHEGRFCQCGEGLKREYWFEDAHYWEVPEGGDDSDDEKEEHEPALPHDPQPKGWRRGDVEMTVVASASKQQQP